MKTLTLFTLTLLFSVTGFTGSEGGGGGDENERRFHEIRHDLKSWIERGGSAGLNLNYGITLDQYNQKMLELLDPHATIISFTNYEIKVSGKLKTCRSFFSESDRKPHIECNIDRFKGTSEAGQYRLVHHEFAGLASIEKNQGASSDYEVSDQLTYFLKETTILRLAIKPQTSVVDFSSGEPALTIIKRLYEKSDRAARPEDLPMLKDLNPRESFCSWSSVSRPDYVASVATRFARIKLVKSGDGREIPNREFVKPTYLQAPYHSSTYDGYADLMREVWDEIVIRKEPRDLVIAYANYHEYKLRINGLYLTFKKLDKDESGALEPTGYGYCSLK